MDRRTFLQLLSTGALASTLPASIARALSVSAKRVTGSIADVQNIVILMQENRSFDHYFGTLRGVRGFSDPRAVMLPSGNPVYCQASRQDSYVLPFRPELENLGLRFLEDLAHDWTSTHLAWNQGNYDQWVQQKGTQSMAYLTREDIPFHFALADAFTVCDAYHCSVFGPTHPNRYHMWTGWTGNDGTGNGPVLDNAEAGYSWLTYPEVLQNAGISWKIYQDQGNGLDAMNGWGYDGDAYLGNFGDNALLYFTQYQNALPGSPLFQNARTGTNAAAGGTLFDAFRQDASADTLPQVSWIVPPEALSEHPNWPANYGAWYISQILDALTANPEVWNKTAFFITYDENDGFFDHVVPPTPPSSRAQGLSTVDVTNEIFAGNSSFPAGPYGLGPRVPMLVISPWSTGGWVCSEVFDHTSLIRFIQARFGSLYPSLLQSNITPWRGAVTGDLTSAFDFTGSASTAVADFRIPSTKAYVPPNNQRYPSNWTAPPATQTMPVQETGVRPARPVPYVLNTAASFDLEEGQITIQFINSGAQAAVFQVRSAISEEGPWTYTVQAGESISDSWAMSMQSEPSYDLSVYGPNGFFRRVRGSVSTSASAFQCEAAYSVVKGGITLNAKNISAQASQLSVLTGYTQETITQAVEPAASFENFWLLDATGGWYDLVLTSASDPSFRQDFSGHLESGMASITDPAIGGGINIGRGGRRSSGGPHFGVHHKPDHFSRPDADSLTLQNSEQQHLSHPAPRPDVPRSSEEWQ